MRLNVSKTCYSRSAKIVGAVSFLWPTNNLIVRTRKCGAYVSVDTGAQFVLANWDFFVSLLVICDVMQGLISYVIRKQ